MSKSNKQTLNASEALYGFAGWLTSRATSVTFGASHDAAIAAELVDQFIKENNLPDMRADWHLHLIHPLGEVATVEGEVIKDEQ